MQSAERRLNAIVNNTTMAIFLMDEHQHCIFMNQAAEELTGYKLEETLGRPLHDVVHHQRPDGSHYPLEECPIDQAFPERDRMQGEEVFVHKDGHFYPVAFTASPIPDDDGNPVGTIIEVRDMTEEKARKAALAESESRFRNMADHAPVMMWVTDPTGYCLHLNRQWYEFTGQTEAEAEGFGWLEATHPDDRKAAEEVFLRANAERAPFRLEYRLRHVSGAYRWAIDAASPRFGENGEYLGYVGSVIDIHDRRQSEERLNRNEEQLRLATDMAEIGLWDFDVESDTLFWQPRVKAMFGVSDDAAYSIADFYAGLHPDDFDATAEAFADALNPAKRSLYDVEYRTVGKEDGVIRWVAAKGRAIFDHAGNCRRVLGTAIDITDRKRDEQMLKDINATLEQRVADEIARRDNAEEALRQAQKMEAVGQLTGGIAHDFNNLLTVVTGNIDMAGRALEASGVTDSRARRALDNAMKGAERAASLTQRLLAFSRRQPLAPKALDVDKLVSGMSDMLNRTLGETVHLEVVTSPSLWRTEADPHQLESAILNLAVNARDAMSSGGTLTIETANARLDEEYSAAHAEVAPGQYVVISVSDTGQGMDKETIARAFEPFFTTKEVGKGTGLGLSMVYGFVKQSGGHVKVYSEEDHGTTVKIYLPRLMSGEPDESGEITAGLEVSPRQECILVVEDDDDVRSYSVDCLRDLGYHVIEAHDGPAALRLLERQGASVDLLFTDVVMPNMSGRELADLARQTHPQLKVLYTSGYTRNAIVHGGRLDAGVEMIAKPFTVSALAQKIRDVLDTGRSRRVLIVEADATVRLLAAEALANADYGVEEAANATEALGKVRAAQGRYDAVVIGMNLADRAGDALALELRALYADLPLLIAGEGGMDAVKDKFSDDRCTDVLTKPFSGAMLIAGLKAVYDRCKR
ncbi:PAS domain S-box protein [Sphingomonas sp. IW22]|uniref:PAS domain S-box protein n=1 Tax=Sphingomonas sp. IW22 TaxID=3242489 RepID=UPI003520A4DA